MKLLKNFALLGVAAALAPWGLLAEVALPTPIASTPTVNADGTLRTPANFFTANAAALSSVVAPPWSAISSKPTTLAGFGITDAQGLDSDLTAIALLSTTSFGRSCLTVADAAALRSLAGVVIGTDVLAPSGSGSALTALNATQLTFGVVPAARLPLGVPAGAQALDANAIADPATLGALDFPIVQRARLAAALAASSLYRVAVGAIGDSNQAFEGTGFGYYYQQELYAQYGCFGTGLLPLASPYTLNIPGYLSGAGRNNVGATTGAPAALHAYSPGAPSSGGTDGIYSYTYVASGSTQAVESYQWSTIVSPTHPLGINGALKFRLSYGTFETGSTSYTPRVRAYTGAGSTLAVGSTINPVTGAYGVADYVIDVAAGSHPESYALVPSNFGTSLTGPYIGYYGSVENADKSTGLSYSTLLRWGGASLRQMLAGLNTHGAQALQEYMRQQRLQLTGATKSMVWFINSGLNDQGDSGASLGAVGGLDSSTAAGWRDNAEGIIDKLQAAWIAAGGTSETIHFSLIVSHPYLAADGGKSGLWRYRQEAARVANSRSNVSAINLAALRDYADFVAADWYDAGGNFHLKPAGYAAISKAVVRTIASGSRATPALLGDGSAITGMAATQVTTVPAGGLAATTQAATNAELDAEKAALVGILDIEITDTTKGLILKSPDGSRFRLKVDDTGVLSTTEL